MFLKQAPAKEILLHRLFDCAHDVQNMFRYSCIELAIKTSRLGKWSRQWGSSHQTLKACRQAYLKHRASLSHVQKSLDLREGQEHLRALGVPFPMVSPVQCSVSVPASLRLC